MLFRNTTLGEPSSHGAADVDKLFELPTPGLGSVARRAGVRRGRVHLPRDITRSEIAEMCASEALVVERGGAALATD